VERLPELIIVDSARSHGFTDGQITHAFVNAFRAFDEDDLVMVIGPADGSGVTLLEVGYLETGDRRTVVVHAMKARPKYLR
jgi:hypothetical protein